MIESEAVKEFKDGMTALRDSSPREALEHMRKAARLNKDNPFYLSYMGLTLAMVERKLEEAEDLCYAALRMKRNQPEFYLNLAEVYRRARKKEDAVWILTSGLEFTKRDPRLSVALGKLGVRRPPIIRFLDRKNFLNRQMGRLRRRAGQGRDGLEGAAQAKTRGQGYRPPAS